MSFFTKNNKFFLISSKNSIFVPLFENITFEFITMNIVQVTGYRIQGTGYRVRSKNMFIFYPYALVFNSFCSFIWHNFFRYWPFNEFFFIQHFFDCYGLLPRNMHKRIAVFVKILWLLCHSATVFFIMYSYSSVKLNRWLFKFKDLGCRNFESVSKCRK